VISATSSKANTTINLAATVFSTDLYKNLIRPKALEKELIQVARIFTILFGAATVGIAMLVPYIGGIVDFVLSIASIAGGALFAPIIWSLFSKRQTAYSVVTASIIALVVSIFFKMIAPSLINIKLSRTIETIVGQGIPLLVLFLFEMYYSSKGMIAKHAYVFSSEELKVPQVVSLDEHNNAEKQNIFGIRIIALAMAAVSIGIITLGLLAVQYKSVVIIVGGVIFVAAIVIWRAAVTRQHAVRKLFLEG
jgi:Na+/proline symporter